jgi:hypothetical protein
MLSVIMLSVIMLSVIMLSVVATNLRQEITRNTFVQMHRSQCYKTFYGRFTNLRKNLERLSLASLSDIV